MDNNLEKACESVIRYLNNFNPHASIVVTSNGIYQLSTDKFILIENED